MSTIACRAAVQRAVAVLCYGTSMCRACYANHSTTSCGIARRGKLCCAMVRKTPYKHHRMARSRCSAP